MEAAAREREAQEVRASAAASERAELTARSARELEVRRVAETSLATAAREREQAEQRAADNARAAAAAEQALRAASRERVAGEESAARAAQVRAKWSAQEQRARDKRLAQERRESERRERRVAPVTTPAARATVPPSAAPGSPLIALGLAVAIFLGAVSAWHVQPWHAPHQEKVEKLPLKLDYRLDLQRNSPRPTGPSGTP